MRAESGGPHDPHPSRRFVVASCATIAVTVFGLSIATTLRPDFTESNVV